MIVLGLDPSSRKLALVVREDRKTCHFSAVKMPDLDISQRSYAAYEAVGVFLHGLGVLPPVRHAFVEAPIVGMTRDIQSTVKQATVSGGAQAALVEWGFGVHLVAPSSWKKTVIGKGNARKDEVGPIIKREWPGLWLAVSGDQDLLDASALVLHGESLVARSDTDFGL